MNLYVLEPDPCGEDLEEMAERSMACTGAYARLALACERIRVEGGVPAAAMEGEPMVEEKLNWIHRAANAMAVAMLGAAVLSMVALMVAIAVRAVRWAIGL
jgi:hypothetical protein